MPRAGAPVGVWAAAINGVASSAHQAASPAIALRRNVRSVAIEARQDADGDGDVADGVLAITTDSPRRAVYAATRDGLWLHHLQATPRPPIYRGEDLTMRWVGIAAVCVVASGLSVAGMLRLTRPS